MDIEIVGECEDEVNNGDLFLKFNMGKFKKRLILVGVIIFLFGFFGCVLI